MISQEKVTAYSAFLAVRPSRLFVHVLQSRQPLDMRTPSIG
ncbi:hypothetical protein [Streptomyces sp. NPDC054863]